MGGRSREGDRRERGGVVRTRVRTLKTKKSLRHAHAKEMQVFFRRKSISFLIVFYYYYLCYTSKLYRTNNLALDIGIKLTS